jgi:chemotaxis receptor (MCP) glutamine deamidase CheD
VHVLAITQGWPVSVSLADATEALAVLEDIILPQQGNQGQDVGDLAIEATIAIIGRFGANLLEAQRIRVVSRLLPRLRTLVSVPLRVSTLQAPAE